MKKMTYVGAMLILPVIAAGYLLYSLENYGRVVHSDASVMVTLVALICALFEYAIWAKSRKWHFAYTVIALLAAVVLVVVIYTAEKIPFCVECDHVTAEDLGFLTRWITPMETAQ